MRASDDPLGVTVVWGHVINLDHNASTPLDPAVRDAIWAQMTGPQTGNPSSVHLLGQRARGVLEAARRAVAQAIGAEPLDVTFVSGGTESINLALLGLCRRLMAEGAPSGVLTSPLEHPAVLQSARRLEAAGCEVTFLEVDAQGRIEPEAVAAALRARPGTGLISLAAANHELGNTYDIPSMVRAAREVRPDVLFHTDAVQAFGKIPVDFSAWDVDLLSVSSHKIYGPMGAGALIMRRSLALESLLCGGKHERGYRPGTENLVGFHGFGVAAGLAKADLSQRSAKWTELRRRLAVGLREMEGVEIHGCPDANIGNTVLASFAGCTGELLLMNLDLEEVAVSTGSACTSGKLRASAIMLALGYDEVKARSVLRFSLGKDNDQADVERVLELMPGILRRTRASVTAGGGGGD